MVLFNALQRVLSKRGQSDNTVERVIHIVANWSQVCDSNDRAVESAEWNTSTR